MKLFMVEARRALHRRVVWTLLGVAGVGIVIAAVVAFFDSADLDVARLRAEGGLHPAVMTSWWVPGTGDGALAVAALFLAVGGLLGGAAVVGGEWRAGTVGTVLTWEPRRVRLHAARLGACAALAWLLAFILQAVFLAGFLPAVAAHGSTAGADGAWVLSLVGAMARVAVIAALAAVVGGAVATVGRGTAPALAVVGGWLAVGESMVRGWRPGLARHLLGDNATVLLTWADLDDAPWSRPPAVALAVLVTYALVATVLAGAWFRRHDVAGA
ncbi:MAG TPA: hypothetical protein VGL92_11920 [Acidimicrobiia bacterium]